MTLKSFSDESLIFFLTVIIGLINMDKSHGDSEVNKIIEKLLQVKGLKV